MNAERYQVFLNMLEDARIEGETNPQIYLVKEVFHQPAMEFIRGIHCQHTKTLIDRINAGGHHMFNYICCQCGTRLSNFLPFKSLSVMDKLNAYGASLYDQLRDTRQLASFKLGEFYQAGWWGAYNTYLKSNHWRDLREQVLYRDGYQCQLNLYGCTQAATQVHHLTYEHVTREPLADLVSVCNTCHEQHHGRRFYEEPGQHQE